MGSTGGVSLRNTESLTGLEVLLTPICKRNTDHMRSFSNCLQKHSHSGVLKWELWGKYGCHTQRERDKYIHTNTHTQRERCDTHKHTHIHTYTYTHKQRQKYIKHTQTHTHTEGGRDTCKSTHTYTHKQKERPKTHMHI